MTFGVCCVWLREIFATWEKKSGTSSSYFTIHHAMQRMGGFSLTYTVAAQYLGLTLLFPLNLAWEKSLVEGSLFSYLYFWAGRCHIWDGGAREDRKGAGSPCASAACQEGEGGKAGRLAQSKAYLLPPGLHCHPASRHDVLTHILLLLSEASRNMLYHTEIWPRKASWLGAGSNVWPAVTHREPCLFVLQWHKTDSEVHRIQPSHPYKHIFFQLIGAVEPVTWFACEA